MPMINLPANILIKSKKPAPGAVTRARIFFKLNTADPELSGRRNIFISSIHHGYYNSQFKTDNLLMNFLADRNPALSIQKHSERSKYSNEGQFSEGILTFSLRLLCPLWNKHPHNTNTEDGSYTRHEGSCLFTTAEK